jgi:group I intron endonuclease
MKNTLHKYLYLAKENFKLNLLSGESKTGIYQLVNLINGKTYVGSSVNLIRRINEYLNPLYITRNIKKGNSAIMNALLKYGYINFGIRILEIIDFYSNQSKSERKSHMLAKEQHFMDLIKPEYNINKKLNLNIILIK